MSLTFCRECGAAVPAGHTCAKCGASLAPVVLGAYRPAPPRPPEKPERRGWLATAGWVAGWVIVAAGCVLVGRAVLGQFAAADRHATERTEVKREREYLMRVGVWLQDTSATAPPPDTTGRPAPTSVAAKRMWVMGRVLVDRPLWEREIMARHGVRSNRPPATWGTPRYVANASAYPEVEAYVEGRAAAVAEIEKTSAGWLAEHVAALARESGMPAGEIRAIFPPDFRGAAVDDARHAEAMLQVHRHLVRVDPRVNHTGGDVLSWAREADIRRFQALTDRLRDAQAYAVQASERRMNQEVAALNRWIR